MGIHNYRHWDHSVTLDTENQGFTEEEQQILSDMDSEVSDEE